MEYEDVIDLETARRTWKTTGHELHITREEELQNAKEIRIASITDPDEFLDCLVWPAMEVNRLLTPIGKPHAVRQVAERLREWENPFAALSSDLGRDPATHTPCWFELCLKYYTEFDSDKLGMLMIRTANDTDKQFTPDSRFFILEGAHRSLVIAKRFLIDGHAFQPVKVLALLT